MRLVISFAVIALVIAFSEAAPKTGKAAPFVIPSPSFSRLLNAYPTGSRSAWTLKREMGLPDWLYPSGRTPNTCAIRMSKTFHDAGLGIDRSRVRSCSTSSARVNGNGKEYIIRALFFRCYLRAIWGSPDRTGIQSSSDISGETGVVIFSNCGGIQHIDLWDGSTCSLGCNFFSRCTTIEMYNLQ